MIGGMKTQAETNRLVPIHLKIQELIKYYYDLSPGPNLFYDYNSKGKEETLTYDKYRGRFKKIMDRHGWTDYSPSCPRHTFSTKAKEAHMEELARKRMMGHEVTDVTDKHYTHLDLVKYLSAEIKKFNTIFHTKKRACANNKHMLFVYFKCTNECVLMVYQPPIFCSV